MDSACSGPDFGASAVPSLKQYLRDVAKAVPSPKGGSVYDQWKAKQDKPKSEDQPEIPGAKTREPAAIVTKDVKVGDLGSGSDYTAFLQHLGVPSADITSHGPYGVYHSAFDDFAWFTKFADPTFVYEQQMARVYGIIAMRIASADVLPLNYEEYGKEISEYVKAADANAKATFGEQAPSFADAANAAARLQKAGAEALVVRACSAMPETESGPAQCRTGIADGWTPRPSLVQTRHLRARREYRIRSGGDPRSE